MQDVIFLKLYILVYLEIEASQFKLNFLVFFALFAINVVVSAWRQEKQASHPFSFQRQKKKYLPLE